MNKESSANRSHIPTDTVGENENILLHNFRKINIETIDLTLCQYSAAHKLIVTHPLSLSLSLFLSPLFFSLSLFLTLLLSVYLSIYGLVYLFNGILNLVSYLMSKPPLQNTRTPFNTYLEV